DFKDYFSKMIDDIITESTIYEGELKNYKVSDNFRLTDLNFTFKYGGNTYAEEPIEPIEFSESKLSDLYESFKEAITDTVGRDKESEEPYYIYDSDFDGVADGGGTYLPEVKQGAIYAAYDTFFYLLYHGDIKV